MRENIECDTCGTWRDGPPWDRDPCKLCAEIEAKADATLLAWVEKVATKAAADAVSAYRARLVGEE